MNKYVRKTIVSVALVVVNIFVVLNVYATGQIERSQDMQYHNGELKINGREIVSADTVLYNGDNVLFPMRRIFEELGATVEWNGVEQDIVVDYDREQYVCKISPVNKYFPDIKALTVQNIKNLGRTDFDSYIQLNDMGVRGSFCIVNDYTYLYQDTAERLFTALGCKVIVNSEENSVYIDTEK